MRKQAARQRTQQQHERGAQPAIPLGIVDAEQLRIAEQITINARQHDARQRVVLERAAGDGLAAGLEGDERDGHQGVPGDVLAGPFAEVGGAPGDDGGGGDAEQGLGGEGGEEGGAALGREEAVEAREEEGADAEGQQRGAGFDPAGALGRGGEAEADVDGVSFGGRY